MATKTGSRERLYGYKTIVQSPGNKMENRPASNDLYHSWRWTKASREFRKTHPLCDECKRKGIIKPAEVTDHIIPYPLCNFWDRTNWQALCKKCNEAKGNSDKYYLNGGMG